MEPYLPFIAAAISLFTLGHNLVLSTKKANREDLENTRREVSRLEAALKLSESQRLELHKEKLVLLERLVSLAGKS